MTIYELAVALDVYITNIHYKFNSKLIIKDQGPEWDNDDVCIIIFNSSCVKSKF